MIDEHTLLKVLNADGTPCHGGHGAWHLPTNGRPGRWMRRIPNPVTCQRGYHLCHPPHLLEWIGPALFVAEADGALVERDTKLVVERARLLERVETWTDRTMRLFACDCAERALDRRKMQDPRARGAITTARAYADGQATLEQLRAARDAAWAAARDAAWDAAWGAERAWQTARLLHYLRGEVGQ